MTNFVREPINAMYGLSYVLESEDQQVKSSWNSRLFRIPRVERVSNTDDVLEIARADFNNSRNEESINTHVSINCERKSPRPCGNGRNLIFWVKNIRRWTGIRGVGEIIRLANSGVITNVRTVRQAHERRRRKSGSIPNFCKYKIKLQLTCKACKDFKYLGWQNILDDKVTHFFWWHGYEWR